MSQTYAQSQTTHRTLQLPRAAVDLHCGRCTHEPKLEPVSDDAATTFACPDCPTTVNVDITA